MKEKVMYECEICGRTYPTKEEALECERKQWTVKKVIRGKYNTVFSHPERIEVELSNGVKAVYDFAMILH